MTKLKATTDKIDAFIEKEKLRSLADVGIFIFLIYGFHLLWKLALPWMADTNAYKVSTAFMIEKVFAQSSWIIDKVLGIDFKTVDKTMYFAGNKFIGITSGCSGLKLFLEWIVLMVFYPGPWRPKTWFIPAGLIVVHLTNLFRVVVLAVLLQWKPEYWDLSHDYVLRPFFYFVMFLMWMFWEEKYRLPLLKAKKEKLN